MSTPGNIIMWGICGVCTLALTVAKGERKWVERNGSNRPPVPWVESSPFRNWVEWTWVDLEKCQTQGRQNIDFDPSPFDPIRPQSIRPKLFDQKGRPNSFRPISFDPFHAIPSQRPARTTIASRSSFPLGLCSYSTWLNKMGI